MAKNLTPPKRGYSFKDHALSKPGQPLPGDRLDAELDRITNALADIHRFLQVSLDGDGTLRGSTVAVRNLMPGAFAPQLEQVMEVIDETIKTLTQREKTSQHLVTQAQNYLKAIEGLVAQVHSAQTKTEEAQETAQSAQKDVLAARARTESALSTLGPLQLDAQTSASSARIAEDMAYRWAEKTDGPVFVPNGGDPVDSGFFSAKFHALRTGVFYDQIEIWHGEVRDWHNEIETVFYPEVRDLHFDFRSTYFGSFDTPPTQDPFGNPPTAGDMYFNTNIGAMFVWDNTIPGWTGFQGATISSFLQLTDTPAAFGTAGQAPVVNAARDALEWAGPFLPLAGGTLTNFLTLNAAPTADLHAATKAYVDSKVTDVPIGNYLPLTGGTLTGNLNVPTLTASSAIQAHFNGNNALTFNRNAITWAFGSLSAGEAVAVRQSDVLAARFEPAGTSSPNPTTIMTREKGDARYLQLTGGTVTGLTSIRAEGSVLSTFRIHARATDGITDFSFRRNDGDLPERWDIRANVFANGSMDFRKDPEGLVALIEPTTVSANNDKTIMTREKGDARYVNRAGDTMTGLLVAPSVRVTGDIVSRSDSDQRVVAQNVAGVTASILAHVNSDQSWRFWEYNPATGAFIGERARIEAAGPAANFTVSVMTREKGDARYPQLGAANTFVTGQVFDGQVFFGRTGQPGALPQVVIRGRSSDNAARIRFDNNAGTELAFMQIGTDGRFAFNNGAGGGSATVARIEAAGAAVPSTSSVVTREKGDARYASRTGLDTHATTLTDWNNANFTGWFMGNNIPNAPAQDGWYLGWVITHNANWVTQEVHRFTNDSSADTATWRRERNNANWGTWYRIRKSQEELDARYAQIGQSGGSITTGATFPPAPGPGDLHYLTVDPVGLYLYLDDGDSTQWVLATGGRGDVGSSGLLPQQAASGNIVFNFLGIPADVRQVEFMFDALRLSGTDHISVQVGDSSGFAITGYASISQQGTAWVRSLIGMVVNKPNAADALTGNMTLSRMAGNKWVQTHTFARDVLTNVNMSYGSGSVTLAGELDRVRVNRTGTNTFAAGSVSVRWIK